VADYSRRKARAQAAAPRVTASATTSPHPARTGSEPTTDQPALSQVPAQRTSSDPPAASRKVGALSDARTNRSAQLASLVRIQRQGERMPCAARHLEPGHTAPEGGGGGVVASRGRPEGRSGGGGGGGGSQTERLSGGEARRLAEGLCEQRQRELRARAAPAATQAAEDAEGGQGVLSCELLPHQQEGLRWMVDRECARRFCSAMWHYLRQPTPLAGVCLFLSHLSLPRD
jgi:hypothetical protein